MRMRSTSAYPYPCMCPGRKSSPVWAEDCRAATHSKPPSSVLSARASPRFFITAIGVGRRDFTAYDVSFKIVCAMVTALAPLAVLLLSCRSTTVAFDNCSTALDCSGGNGNCVSGRCQCVTGWTGARCGSLDFAPRSARVAYARDPTEWTWGGSMIRSAKTGEFHLFSSALTNGCGIQHYCANSQVLHLTSPNSSGPFTRVGVALAPRAGHWDNGAIHGILARRLPNGTYALFYMGSKAPRGFQHPNCTTGSGDVKANRTLGSHAGRRIGIATADSLDGPWQRRPEPLFGPDAYAWDTSDVSNPMPIISTNGSVVMIYKGNGKLGQHMGLAFAPSLDGPWTRNGSDPSVQWAKGLPGEDPYGWIDNHTGVEVFHAIFKNVNASILGSGAHLWSLNGRVWHGYDNSQPGAEHAYDATVDWAETPSDPVHSGRTSTLARRERPQLILGGTSSDGSSYGSVAGGVLVVAAEDCDSFVAGAADAGAGLPCRSGIGTSRSFTMLQAIKG
eukprot:COSAG06_NODE_209_length_20178_cov_4.309478_9_plen_504_part_00